MKFDWPLILLRTLVALFAANFVIVLSIAVYATFFGGLCK